MKHNSLHSASSFTNWRAVQQEHNGRVHPRKPSADSPKRVNAASFSLAVSCSAACRELSCCCMAPLLSAASASCCRAFASCCAASCSCCCMAAASACAAAACAAAVPSSACADRSCSCSLLTCEQTMAETCRLRFEGWLNTDRLGRRAGCARRLCSPPPHPCLGQERQHQQQTALHVTRAAAVSRVLQWCPAWRCVER